MTELYTEHLKKLIEIHTTHRGQNVCEQKYKTVQKFPE